MSTDYKDSLFLPRTEFPMRAGLPKLEMEILREWEKLNLFECLREDARGREKFILHDGPPYANGNIHIGHALNKILKDTINRSQQMMGKDANYVPGWDCHGLPIEWQIEERYRAAGKNKDDVPIGEFRKECRNFADHWIKIQTEEFKRLGVIGDWKNPYTTMTYAAEAQIVAECLKFLMDGSLYRGARPVMWSVVEQTALAEAEIEYHDHTSTTVHVKFPVISAQNEKLAAAKVVIWTTTPWTMPGNRAICFGPELGYLLVEVTEVDESSLARVGESLVLCGDLVREISNEVGIKDYNILGEVSNQDLEKTVCSHPWRGRGYDFDVPLLPGSHVTAEQGTGFVHTAPGHGTEDFEVGIEFNLEIPLTVGGDGLYCDHVPIFAGQHVFKADAAIVAELSASGSLLAAGKLRHSYPHSWRSKAPLIFRNTPQWFISMTRRGLRHTALASIDQVRWIPGAGRNRIRSMIADRPDWVLSRQRAWGVPITLFLSKVDGEPLKDETVNRRIVEAVCTEGADAWFNSEPSRFLGEAYSVDDFEAVQDILDVWFDSGSSHAFVLEKRPELKWPASLYLEGSDQHRGYFHSSLLEACGTRGRAPYEAVLTHGFTLDEHGRKMSKSLGNVIAPQEICDKYGADILRQWVVSSDYAVDQRIGNEIIKGQVDAYRRIRNTYRFLLGNLADFSENERLPEREMPELECWLLHRLSELNRLIHKCCDDFDFHKMFINLSHFCTVDLSAFYFDIRKDSLYCDPKDAIRRRATRTLLDKVFDSLTVWMAPIHCFTAEEAWKHRYPETASIHLQQFPNFPSEWFKPDLGERWGEIRLVRRVVTGALEVARKDEKLIGSSLQALVRVFVSETYRKILEQVDLAEVCITSEAHYEIVKKVPVGCYTIQGVDDVGVIVERANGNRCGRCWQVLREVPEADALCGRCKAAVGATDF